MQAKFPGLRPDENAGNAYNLVDNGVVFKRIVGQLGNLGSQTLPTGKVSDYWTGLTRSNQPERLFSSQSIYDRSLTYPGYITPGVSDQSLYDWENINWKSANYAENKAKIYEVTVEQKLIENLYLELGFHSEHLETLFQSSEGNKLRVDVNTHYLDGTPNPYVGQLYIDSSYTPLKLGRKDLDTMRATLAYSVDFTDKSNWMKWLGRHNIMGLGQYVERDNQLVVYNPVVITKNDHWWSRENDGTYKDIQSSSNQQKFHYMRFYMGDGAITQGQGTNPQHPYYPSWGEAMGPLMPSVPMRHFVWEGRDGNSDYPVKGGSPVGQWVDETAEYAFITHNEGGTERRQQRMTSYAFATQSYFWEDRIVATLGWRYDKQESRRASITDEDGNYLEDPSYIAKYGYDYETDPLYGVRNAYGILRHFPSDWDAVDGSTTTMGLVVRPFEGRNVSELLQSFGFFYNRADSFEPAPVEINLYGETLPDPTGEADDFGIQFSTLEGKLHAKVNYYKSTVKNSRNGGDTAVMTWRAARQEWEGEWGLLDFWEWNIEVRDGLELGSLDFFDVNNEATIPYVQELYELSQLPNPTALRGATYAVGFNDVRNVISEGVEFSVDYNPMSNFNIKLTAAKQESIIEGAAPATAQWVDERFQVWKTVNNYEGVALAHGFGDNPPVDWWNGVNPYSGETSKSDSNYPFDVNDPTAEDIRWQGRPAGPEIINWLANGMAILKELDGKPSPQYPKWKGSVLATYRFSDGVLNGFMVGGSARWEDKKGRGLGR